MIIKNFLKTKKTFIKSYQSRLLFKNIFKNKSSINDYEDFESDVALDEDNQFNMVNEDNVTPLQEEDSELIRNKKAVIASIYEKQRNIRLFNDELGHKFDDFLIAMNKFVTEEIKRNDKVDLYVQQLNVLNFQSKHPLKEMLQYYQIITNEIGFDSKVLSHTLLTLGKAFQSRELNTRFYSDYNHWELLHSYRMYHIVEDFKYALYYQYANMSLSEVADGLRGLRLLDYKETSLAHFVYDKLFSLLTGIPLSQRFEKDTDKPSYGKLGFYGKNKYEYDYQNDEQFTQYLNKLMEIKVDEEGNETKFNDLVTSIQDVVNTLHDLQGMQIDVSMNIESILDHYNKIIRSINSNPELFKNDFIKFQVFKLQDALVSAGYLNIETLSKINTLTMKDLDKLKAENSISVIQNVASIYFPNLFNEASVNFEKNLERTGHYRISKEKFDWEGFSKVLIELAHYSNIELADVKGKDFFNKSIVPSHLRKDYSTEKNYDYTMDILGVTTDYTQLKHNTINFFKQIEEHLVKRIDNERIDSSVLIHIFGAFALNNVPCHSLAEKIFNNLDEALSTYELLKDFSDRNMVDYLFGLANGGLLNGKVSKIFKFYEKHLKLHNINDAENLVKVVWSYCVFNHYKSEHFVTALFKLNEIERIKFERNHPLFENFEQIKLCLKQEVLINEKLPFELSGSLLLEEKQQTYVPKVDPHRMMLNNAIIESLTINSANYNYITGLTKYVNETLFESLSIKADIVLGFFGSKIAVFLLNNGSSSQISGKYQLVKRLYGNKGIECLFIPITEIIETNLKTLQMKVKKEVSLENYIISQIGADNDKAFLIQINNYIQSLVLQISNKFQSLDTSTLKDDDVNKISLFIESIQKIIELNNDLAIQYSHNLFIAKSNELQTELNSLIKRLSELPKEFINLVNQSVSIISSSNVTIDQFFDKIIQVHHKLSKTSNKNDETVNEWTGKRFTNELIGNPTELNKKNISIEFINNNIMWHKDYQNYEDWDVKLREFYDNLNYFTYPSNNKHLFNSHELGARNVPMGIFPHPTHKRIMNFSNLNPNLPNFFEFNDFIQASMKHNNNLPHEIPDEVSLMVNLLNIKNALKQNFNDHEILNYITKFNFIDNLINESLENNNKVEKTAQFLNRDQKAFLDFLKSLDDAIEPHDDFDKFIMKEYYKDKTLLDVDPSIKNEEERKKILEQKMKKRLEETEDVDALSIFNPNTVSYEFDIRYVLASSRKNFPDEDLNNPVYLNNLDELLLRKRQIAQRNLILMRIFHKLYLNETGNAVQLTENEKKYINKVCQIMKESNGLNLENILLDSPVTNMTFNDLSIEDKYSLESLPNIDLSKSGNFALSELILELSFFIDNNIITNIIKQIFNSINNVETTLKSQNKEQYLIALETKENLWRLSGQLDSFDKQKLDRFWKIKRTQSKFDRIWLELDLKSLDHILNQINSYENNLHLLEQWLKRKEFEIENRINLPADNLYGADNEINDVYRKKQEKVLKSILCKLFNASSVEAITGRELNKFVNELCRRVYLFNYKYPELIIDLFDGLLLCPNLYAEDKQLLMTYQKIFSVERNTYGEPLSIYPIKLEGEKLQNNINEDFYKTKEFKERLRNSQIDYIKPLVKSFLSFKI